MQINSGHFIADGSAVNVDVGFVPDMIMAFEGIEETNPAQHFYFKELANTANGNGQYGMVRAGTGTVTKHAAATNGFAEYDTGTLKQMLPAPTGTGELGATLAANFVAGTSQPTARSTSVLGTIVKPSTADVNGFIYECTASTGVYGTEPTWPTLLGDTVVDDQTNTWMCREEKLKQIGGKGFTVGATIATDGEILCFKAEQHDKAGDMGDADSSSPVSYYDE